MGRSRRCSLRGTFCPSFKYAGKAFDKSEWKGSEISRSKMDGGEISVVEYLSPDNAVKLRLTIKNIKKYNVIEWLPELENVSDAPKRQNCRLQIA